MPPAGAPQSPPPVLATPPPPLLGGRGAGRGGGGGGGGEGGVSSCPSWRVQKRGGVFFRTVGKGHALASGTHRLNTFLLLLHPLTTHTLSLILILIRRCRRSSDISDERFRLYCCCCYWTDYSRAGNARRDCHVNAGGGGSGGGGGGGGRGSLGGRRRRQSRVQRNGRPVSAAWSAEACFVPAGVDDRGGIRSTSARGRRLGRVFYYRHPWCWCWWRCCCCCLWCCRCCCCWLFF